MVGESSQNVILHHWNILHTFFRTKLQVNEKYCFKCNKNYKIINGEFQKDQEKNKICKTEKIWILKY